MVVIAGVLDDDYLFSIFPGLILPSLYSLVSAATEVSAALTQWSDNGHNVSVVRKDIFKHFNQSLPRNSNALGNAFNASAGSL